MGSWGYGVRDDDFVGDVIGEFEDLRKAGKSVGEATAAVTLRFRGALDDHLEGPRFWLAVAEAQWAHGALEPDVFQRVREDLASGRSLTGWEEDPRGLTKRRAALERFIKKLEVPKTRPAKRPKTIVRAPKFVPGTCLSIHRPNGDYGAAVVLAARHSTPEYGLNLVGVLDYCSTESPPMDAFLGRRWRVLSQPGERARIDVGWYYPIGFRKVQALLSIVGTIDLLESDPQDSTLFFGWGNLA